MVDVQIGTIFTESSLVVCLPPTLHPSFSMCVCVRVPVCVHVHMLSYVQLFATPWTVAHWAPLSMGFFKQE